MGLTLLTPPASEPVTLADAKLHLRESDSAQDTVISALITAARRYVEEKCQRSLITQTWVLTLDQFPYSRSAPPCYSDVSPSNEMATDIRRALYGIRLRRGPVQSVTSLQYYDSAGNQQTFGGGNWEADLTALVPRICPVISSAWPSTQSKLNAVSVTYITGFGAAAAVPGDIIAAIKLLIGYWYEQREAANVGNIVELPLAVDALLGPYTIAEVA